MRRNYRGRPTRPGYKPKKKLDVGVFFKHIGLPLLIIIVLIGGFFVASNLTGGGQNVPEPTAPATQSPEPTVEPTPEPTPESTPTPWVINKTAEHDAQYVDIYNGYEGEKVAYLTFDDGPNKSITSQILDILRRYNIKATFFQVGSLIEENPDVAKRVSEEGHLIGNHSYGHTYEKLYSSKESFKEEYEMCAKLIQDITKEDYTPVMRLPGGSHNTGTYGEIKQELIEILSQNGVYHCNWNALSGDAEGSYKSKAQLIQRVKSTSKGKNQVVVLMHDASTKKQTVEALPEIIEYFISEGYVFSRLDKPLF